MLIFLGTRSVETILELRFHEEEELLMMMMQIKIVHAITVLFESKPRVFL